MAKPTFARYWRIRTESSWNAGSPDSGADWNIGGNGGGANGWLDLPANKDQDGLQPKSTIIFPTPAAGVRAMNTADPVAGAYPTELGALDVVVYPELIDRVFYAVMGGVNRVQTAGSAAKSSVAFASLATLDTQPNGTEQLKFVISASTAASSAAINIIQNAVTVETITIGSNAGTVNGTYYSKGAYNGSVNAITFSIAGTVTDGTVVVSGVDYTTNTFTQANTNPSLVIEQGGFPESGSTADSEFFPGVVIPGMTLSYDRAAPDNLLMANLTIQGLNPTNTTKTAYDNDTALYTRPIAGWHGAATVDGVSYAEIVSGSFTFTPNTALFATSSGTQQPTGKIEGEFEITGEITILPDSDARWEDYRNSTNRALVLDFLTPYYVVDSTPYRIQLTMSRVFFGDYTRNRQNMALGATIPFRAIYNSTDSGAGKIVTRCRMPI